ncbi:MAG: polyhydroxybutyrate depolymerase [Pseudomonadota bacterium]
MRGILVILGLIAAGPAFSCGSDTDCMIGDRHYRIAMPEAHDGATPVPAVFFVHGYKGKASGVMRNGSLRGLANDLGAALIAVQSDGPGWEVPNNPRDPKASGEDEYAYFDAVRADAAARFPLDLDRVMVSGFSSGGMMVWNLACARPGDYAGFVPVAGTFWLNPPETCAEPVASIVHIHGDADNVVPLMGRPIRDVKQGEVPEALAMYRAFGDFPDPQAVAYDGLDCEESRNVAGRVLDFCMFSGGHSFRTEHLRHGWDRLVGTGQM